MLGKYNTFREVKDEVEYNIINKAKKFVKKQEKFLVRPEKDKSELGWFTVSKIQDKNLAKRCSRRPCLFLAPSEL